MDDKGEIKRMEKKKKRKRRWKGKERKEKGMLGGEEGD